MSLNTPQKSSLETHGSSYRVVTGLQCHATVSYSAVQHGVTQHAGAVRRDVFREQSLPVPLHVHVQLREWSTVAPACRRNQHPARAGSQTPVSHDRGTRSAVVTTERSSCRPCTTMPWALASRRWRCGYGHAHLVAEAAYSDVQPTSAPPSDHVDHGARPTRTALTILDNLSTTVTLSLRSRVPG